MKPSEKATQAMLAGLDKGWFDAKKALEAAYAIDVDPLLAAKDAEIERLKNCINVYENRVPDLHQRISELEAENAKLGQALAQLNSAPVEELKRIEELEAENVKLKETCAKYDECLQWSINRISKESRKENQE
jgi:FtsZ-binding cell division protein ZapB